METAHFDNLPTVKRTGIIFRPGDYGDKGCYTDADIDAMAGDTPLPVNLEHRKSLLDDKLGQLTRRFSGYDDQGRKVLLGEWEEPQPLALLLGDVARKASIEIDLKTKQPVGLALTHLPHIADAALFSAYAKFSNGDKEHIQPVAQFAYESASERDAMADEDFGDPTNKLFPVRTQAEFREAMRELAYADDPTAVKNRVLEIAARKGLNINDYEWPYYQSSGVSKPLGTALYSQEEQTDMSTVIETPAIVPAEQPKGFLDSLRALFSSAKPEELEAAESALTSAKTGKTPREIELEAQLAQFTANTETQRVAALKAAAEGKADALIDARRILPAQREAVVAMFTAAAEVDANLSGLACFSEANPLPAQFSMSAQLEELYHQLPAHDKTEEQAGSFEPEQVAVFEQAVTTTKDSEGNTIKVVDGVMKAQNANILAALKGGGTSTEAK